MKCKDCNSTLCPRRTSDAEKDCFYESHPDNPMPRDLWNNDNIDWQALRNQAAISAMQGMLSNPAMYLEEGDTYPKVAVKYADALIEELKRK